MTTASYPGALKTYTDKVDGIDTVKAADINSVQAEVQAIEAALSPATSPVVATDGTHVGYTILATQIITTSAATGSTTFSSISGVYSKLILQIGLTSSTTPGALTFTLNGVSTNYAYTAQVYGTATPTTSTAATSVPLGTPNINYSAVLEIPNYASTFGGKNWQLLGTDRSATGYLATSTITSLTVSAASSTMTVQCTLIGVK